MLRLLSRRINGLLRSSFMNNLEIWRTDVLLCSSIHSSFVNFNIKEETSSTSNANVHSSFRTEEIHETMSTSNESTNENGNSDWEYERDIKVKILDASLSFVPTHGWTKASLSAGAQSIGYPVVVTEMFPLGGSSIVLFFYELCNLQLQDYLKNKEKDDMDKGVNVNTNREEYLKLFIADAIEYRLRLIIPYIDKWPAALASLTLPRVVPSALIDLFTLVDDIAYHAGDRSVDLEWYIRRVGVAGIYKVTELYMLQDKSPDYEDTWAFLRRQLDDAITLYSYIKKSETATKFTKEISTATFTTAKNMLGLNWNR